jgi:penicillin amidase
MMMRTCDRGVASGVVALLATVLVGCGVPDAKSAHPATAVASTSLAADPAVDAATLAASVTIYRDEFGVPHVYGPSDASVIFGEAYAEAEDNWWQVEDNFVRSIGRASELYGEETLLDDYLTRAMETPRLSREEYERASGAMRSLYDAYAEGFNYYLRQHPEVEPRLLQRVEPWYAIALLRFKYHHNEYIGYAGLRRQDTERLLEGAAISAATSPRAILTGATRSTGPNPDPGRFESLAFREEPRPGGERPLGSNEWAIAGSRTRSGHPMLLVNPHVGFFGLAQYTEIHLHSEEGLEFSGQSRFGFMFPYMGHNERLGWTYTDNYSDIGDLYVETIEWRDGEPFYRYGDEWREVTPWTETIGVRAGGDDGEVEPREFRFIRTHHGPVLGIRETETGEPRPLAVRVSMLEEGGWYDQWYDMMRAQSLEEWRRAVARLAVPYQNTMYADADGNIQYIYNAAVPRRSTNYEWSEPVDGSDPGTEWDGYHSLDELPQYLNPDTGYLQNTNSNPFTATDGLTDDRDDFPPYLVGGETDNRRARSSRRILRELRDVTLEDFARAALDTRILAAEEFLPDLLDEFLRLEQANPTRADMVRGPVEELEAWDREATIESIATTLFVLWAEVWDRRGERLQEEEPNWPRLTVLAAIIERLQRDWATWRVPWGDLNRMQRPDASGEQPFDDAQPSLPVAGAPGWLGSVFVFSARTPPGGRLRYGVHGNSFVKVIEFGPEIRGRSILTFGQSGDPASAHYFDQAPLYSGKRFKPAWFSREEVEANAERVYSIDG